MGFCQGILKRKARPGKGGGMPPPSRPWPAGTIPGMFLLALERHGARGGSSAPGRVFPKGTAFLVVRCFAEDFASAEATKGLSGRPLETFGPLQQMGICTRCTCLVEGKGLPYLFRIAEDFASAEATKGLSGRPLETFGPLRQMGICTRCTCLVEGKDVPSPQRKKARLSSRRAFLHGIQ